MRSYADATRRWVPLVVVGGLLGVAAIAASIATPGVHSIPVPRPSERGGVGAGGGAVVPANPFASGRPSASHTAGVVPAWIAWIEGVIALAVVLAVVSILVWHFMTNHWLAIRQVVRDDEETADAMSARREEVIAALDEGIAQLAGDANARSAVIACWVRLEEVAKAAGTPRAPSDAPADLVSRLLGAHQVSTRALTSLADLYRAARFSTAMIDNAMREQAIAALRQIRHELAASAAGPPIDDVYAIGGMNATGGIYATGGDDGWRQP